MEDEDLLKRFALGDPAACEQLRAWSLYAARRYQFWRVRRHTEDIAQDSLIILLGMTQRPDFRVRKSARALISTITGFVADRWVRKERRLVPLSDSYPGGREPDRELDARQREAVLHRILSTLDPRGREVMERKLRDESRSQIMEAMGFPSEGAVGAFLFRCLHQLRSVAKEIPL